MKHIKLLTAAAVATIAFGTVAEAQEMKFWRIGTGGAGGTYYPIGGLIANAISNPPGSRPCDKGGSCGVEGLVAINGAGSGFEFCGVDHMARAVRVNRQPRVAAVMHQFACAARVIQMHMGGNNIGDIVGTQLSGFQNIQHNGNAMRRTGFNDGALSGLFH